MIQYEILDLSEQIDNNKTIASKKFMLCHYWYLKKLSFKSDSEVRNCCCNMKILLGLKSTV